MRVVFVNRENAYDRLGGDTIQMRETAKCLRQLGVTVDERLGAVEEGEYGAYDLVHLFNLQTPTFTAAEAEKASRAGRKIALSTIYWDFGAEVLLAFSPKWRLLSKLAGRKLAEKLARRWNHRVAVERKEMARILELADVWLPNSEAEVQHLRRLYPLMKPVTVVPNGIDVERYDPGQRHPLPHWATERGIGSKAYVLVAARIDEHKNQVAYCRAMAGFGHPIILAGGGDADRIAECQRLGAVWVGPLDGDELLRSYAHARVHALPSFRETPGLATLEAAAMGCSIVSTSIGSVREYFGDRILYCDPENSESMRSATEHAWNAEPNLELSAYVRSEYAWEVAGRCTLEAYRTLVA